MSNEKVVIQDPLGREVNYGIYDNILLNTSDSDKIIYSKLPKVAEEDNDKVLTVINGFWDKRKIEITSIPDWLQNDENAKDFIKNRPFYEFFKTIFDQEIIFEDIDESHQGTWSKDVTGPEDVLEEGNIYRVLYGKKGEEKEYTCKCAYYNDLIYLPGLGNFNQEENKEPFVIIRTKIGDFIQEEKWIVFGLNLDQSEDTVYTCKITTPSGAVKQIDAKFLPTPFFGEREGLLYETPLQNLFFGYSFSDQAYAFFGYGSQLQAIIDAWPQEWDRAEIIFDSYKYSCKPELVENVVKVVGNLPALMGEEPNDIPFVMAVIPKELIDTDLFSVILIQEPHHIFDKFYNGNLPQFQEGDGYSFTEFEMDSFIAHTSYLVNWNNTKYELRTREYVIDGTTCVGLGNTSILGLGEDNTNLEFFVYTKTLEEGKQVGVLVTTNSSVSSFAAVTPSGFTYQCKLDLINKQTIKIDSKYFSDISWNKVFNRPFGVFPKDSVILPRKIFSFDYFTNNEGIDLYLSKIESIKIFDTEYEIEVDGKTYSTIGENNSLNITDGDLLLGIGELDGVMYIVTNQPGEHSIQVILKQEIIQKIDSKFIPEIKALPEVNSTDAGKFLRVSSIGEWQAELISNAEYIGF